MWRRENRSRLDYLQDDDDLTAGVLPLHQVQNLGDDFNFEPDNDALESILNHRPLTHREINEKSRRHQKRYDETESENINPCQEKIQLYESANGKVFMRRQQFSPRVETRSQWADESEGDDILQNIMKPIRLNFGKSNSAKKQNFMLGSTEKKMGNIELPINRNWKPFSGSTKAKAVRINSGNWGKLMDDIPAYPLPRESLSERKPAAPSQRNMVGGRSKLARRSALPVFNRKASVSPPPQAKKTLQFVPKPGKPMEKEEKGETEDKSDKMLFKKPTSQSMSRLDRPAAKTSATRRSFVAPTASHQFERPAAVNPAISRLTGNPIAKLPQRPTSHAVPSSHLTLPPNTFMAVGDNLGRRESTVLIPRESLAWMSQLRRDSATFSELENMMNDQDRQLVNEDDTMSFEAMELRLKTPLKAVPRSQLAAEAVKPAPTTKLQHDSVPEDVAVTPVRKSRLEMVVESVKDVSSELSNLPSDPILSTPTIKSRSLSDLSTIHSSVPCDVQNMVDEDDPNEETNAGEDHEKLVSHHNQLETLPLARSQSEEILPGTGGEIQLSDLVPLDKIQDLVIELERYRTEQDELDRQREELTKRIQQRREEFKAVWGISPLRINKIRSRTQLIGTANKDQNKGQSADQGQNQGVTGLAAEGVKTPDHEPEKRVRFDSGQNDAKVLTPCSPLQALSDPEQQDSPQSIYKNQSFVSLKSSFSFLQTPKASGGPSRRILEPEEQKNESPNSCQPLDLSKKTKQVMPTPMVLRALSNKVREEYALLYATSSPDETEELSADVMKTLKF